MVLVVRSGGAAAAAALCGAPGAASRWFFLFFGLPPRSLQGALRGGAAGLSRGLAARDGQKRGPACRRGLGGLVRPSAVHRLLGQS